MCLCVLVVRAALAECVCLCFVCVCDDASCIIRLHRRPSTISLMIFLGRPCGTESGTRYVQIVE